VLAFQWIDEEIGRAKIGNGDTGVNFESTIRIRVPKKGALATPDRSTRAKWEITSPQAQRHTTRHLLSTT